MIILKIVQKKLHIKLLNLKLFKKVLQIVVMNKLNLNNQRIL